MELLLLVLVPGVIGGLVVALVAFRLRGPHSSVDPFRNVPPSTDTINMARIRVDGIGGLGLVAMAVTVAWFVPRIRQHVLLGLGLGLLLAVVLVLARRHSGPMPSSGKAPGANATLSIDAPADQRDADHAAGPREGAMLSGTALPGR